MTETITTILCIGLLSIYALLGEREKRDLEYHEMRMKKFK